MIVIRFALALLVCSLAHSAAAQTQRSGDTNARAMQQLQQLSAERTQLKGDNDKLKQQVEDLKKQLSAATAAQASLQQKLKAAEASVARDAGSSQQNAEALEKMRAQMQELVTRFHDTAQQLKEVETDRNAAHGKLQADDRELTQCIDKNIGLYQLNTEVLDKLENHGMFSSLAEKEPFTQIQRTRLENLIDGYKDRALDLRTNTKKP
jgi:chromosome segregation ATPase